MYQSGEMCKTYEINLITIFKTVSMVTKKTFMHNTNQSVSFVLQVLDLVLRTGTTFLVFFLTATFFLGGLFCCLVGLFLEGLLEHF